MLYEWRKIWVSLRTQTEFLRLDEGTQLTWFRLILAGSDADGLCPSAVDLAWEWRIQEEEAKRRLDALASLGWIRTLQDGRIIIVRWAEFQGPDSDSVRAARSRARKADVTLASRECHADVTKRDENVTLASRECHADVTKRDENVTLASRECHADVTQMSRPRHAIVTLRRDIEKDLEEEIDQRGCGGEGSASPSPSGGATPPPDSTLGDKEEKNKGKNKGKKGDRTQPTDNKPFAPARARLFSLWKELYDVPPDVFLTNGMAGAMNARIKERKEKGQNGELWLAKAIVGYKFDPWPPRSESFNAYELHKLIQNPEQVMNGCGFFDRNREDAIPMLPAELALLEARTIKELFEGEVITRRLGMTQEEVRAVLNGAENRQEAAVALAIQARRGKRCESVSPSPEEAVWIESLRGGGK